MCCNEQRLVFRLWVYRCAILTVAVCWLFLPFSTPFSSQANAWHELACVCTGWRDAQSWRGAPQAQARSEGPPQPALDPLLAHFSAMGMAQVHSSVRLLA